MSRPVLDGYAADLYDTLAPAAAHDAANGYPLAWFCAALGAMFDPVASWSRDTDQGTGFSNLLDIDRAPVEALGWLAQFVGVTLDPALDETAQRKRIRETAGMKRGTLAALAGAARQYLTGDQTVIVRERDPDPYGVTVVTYAAETPDSSLVLAALMAQKPAGLELSYVVETGQDWATLIANHATWANVIATYPTWDDVLNN